MNRIMCTWLRDKFSCWRDVAIKFEPDPLRMLRTLPRNEWLISRMSTPNGSRLFSLEKVMYLDQLLMITRVEIINSPRFSTHEFQVTFALISPFRWNHEESVYHNLLKSQCIVPDLSLGWSFSLLHMEVDEFLHYTCYRRHTRCKRMVTQ